jgi:hypothetical protein
MKLRLKEVKPLLIIVNKMHSTSIKNGQKIRNQIFFQEWLITIEMII